MKSRANRRTHLEQQAWEYPEPEAPSKPMRCRIRNIGATEISVTPYLPDEFEAFTVKAETSREAARWVVLFGYQPVWENYEIPNHLPIVGTP